MDPSRLVKSIKERKRKRQDDVFGVIVAQRQWRSQISRLFVETQGQRFDGIAVHSGVQSDAELVEVEIIGPQHHAVGIIENCDVADVVAKRRLSGRRQTGDKSAPRRFLTMP